MADAATLASIKKSAPRSNFPQTVLTMSEVSAPNTKQLQYIAQYNQAAASGDWTKCKEILASAQSDSSVGDLNKCKISSEGFNTLVDEIKAVELYYNSEMDTYFTNLKNYVDKCATSELGISDSTSSTTTSYSSAAIDKKLAAITTIASVTVKAASWSKQSNGTYTQTVSVSNMTANSYPLWYISGTPTAEQYESFCYISSMTTASGKVTFTCASDVPTVDLTIMIKGY